MTRLRRTFSFPDTVDETSARLVATGVVAQAAAFLATGWGWVLIPLTFGFLARTLTGPTLSPLGQFVTRVVSPRVPGAHRQVPGPPKRFAQGIGLSVTTVASIGWLVGVPTVAFVAIGVLVAAAALEAGLAVCLGCIVHARLFGCADCADIGDRLRRSLAGVR